jgi:hypothetical protein
LQTNGVLKNLIQKAVHPILSFEFNIQGEDGNINEELTKNICKKSYFTDIVECSLMAEFEGFVGFVVDFKKEKVIKYPIELIDYKNESLKKSYYETEGEVKLKGNAFYLEYSDAHQERLGLFAPITKYCIAIAESEKYWLDYGKQNAHAHKVVYYNNGGIGYTQGGISRADYYDNVANENGNTYNPNPYYEEFNQTKYDAINIAENFDINKIYAIGCSRGEDGSFIPEIEIKSSEDSRYASGNGHTSYKDFIKKNEENLAITILGTTLTTFEGSGNRSMGEVHSEKSDEFKRSREKFVLDFLNGDFKKRMQSLYEFPDNLFFGVNEVQSLSIADASVVSKISNEQGKVLNKDFFNKIGIPEEFIEQEEEIEVEEDVEKEVVEREEKLFGIMREDKVKIVTEKVMVKKSISEEKKTFKYYNCLSGKAMMDISSLVELREFNKNEKLNHIDFILEDGCFLEKLNSKISLASLDSVDNICSDLFKESLNNPDEVWKLGSKHTMLKFYNNVVYSVFSEDGIIESAKCQRCLKDVELLRKGTLIK